MQALPPKTERPWSRRRWGWTAFGIFAAQAGLILTLSPHTRSSPTPSRIEPNFRLVVEAAAQKEVLDTFFVDDPTLFVLPTEHGFSGVAWMKRRAEEYALPEWDEPPRWLDLNQSKLGGTMREFVRTNSAMTLPVAQKIPHSEELEPRTYPEVVDLRPTVLVEGEIAHRVTWKPSTIVTWTNSEPLLDTVVDVSVNGAGDIVSLRLAPPPRSGLRAADEKAMELSQIVRFRPVNSGAAATNITSGRITFHWRTVPPVVTNFAINGGGTY